MNSKKMNIIIAIMVAMFLAAVEGTVVTTAIPTIVKDLNGFKLISWVFSLYLLTSAITTPIYGKLADLYGRKNTLSVGIIIFLIGSSLCGLSSNMYQLIIFRALQGIGAGAIFTVTYTIVGDEFDISERAKVQGWLSTVWGIASLIGPFLGGFLLESLSWHWIFFINIPFGLLSIILLKRNLKENFEVKKHKIDYLGTIILSLSIIALLYGVLLLEKSKSLFSLGIIISILIASVLLILFYFIEKKAEEPIIPLEILTKSNVIANGITFMIAAVLIGMEVYMPLYIQNVLGFGATISGISMAPMSVAWLLSAMILSKAIPKYGEKKVVFISTLILVFSSILLTTLKVSSSISLVISYVFIMGFGFGGAFTILTIMVQASVEYNQRGAATASNSLLKTLGQTVGISVFGSIFNINIVKYFNNLGVSEIDPSSLYSNINENTVITAKNVGLSVNSSLHIIFTVLIIISLICLILSLILPSKLKKESAVNNKKLTVEH
ncbi:EmrB/QacA subfamily drug resistance transporter [Clostridium tetanomorphum]|uniref:MFS transporter n=1 Tax=Clostridium tetanomorphum TaxID=1553 RepID=A0A923EB63_CLOTT|nr:MDR family MFS transporter [Clostridium tetanomorphum]KAJ51122.1 major facilitator superfamily protein [Clostridium tetanomorphum DSM 665]MBC2398041.1 MFS transporter [Clostridium tetanomorphum]MBP1864450.1 EmrB/QacA subfamily drug resistance transporter [Clostridium tetanomorphum]NRS83019.1 EmrB/QacA subfamily drug resistance transporter [Clostridium tetanomorphum]NRZ98885.1 EmrB/QacA subfamily drug resistance transporter [Clostridium tetanomorphum]